jgi:hypothetical protein
MTTTTRRALGRIRQAALFYARRRHRPQPEVYVLGGLPDAAMHAGQTVQVINRNDRLAVSDGATWRWRGTNEIVT